VAPDWLASRSLEPSVQFVGVGCDVSPSARQAFLPSPSVEQSTVACPGIEQWPPSRAVPATKTARGKKIVGIRQKLVEIDEMTRPIPPEEPIGAAVELKRTNPKRPPGVPGVSVPVYIVDNNDQSYGTNGIYINGGAVYVNGNISEPPCN
jgi:hypothetical protein